MDDPNRWPMFIWLVVALGFGSVGASVGLFLWSAAFRRKRPGWFMDSVLLGCSGFVLTAVMMAYIILSQKRLPQEWQRQFGPAVVLAVGLVLVWVSRRALQRIMSSKRKRMLGTAKGEFTVPDDVNDPLPKDVEDEFYK